MCVECKRSDSYCNDNAIYRFIARIHVTQRFHCRPLPHLFECFPFHLTDFLAFVGVAIRFSLNANKFGAVCFRVCVCMPVYIDYTNSIVASS